MSPTCLMAVRRQYIFCRTPSSESLPGQPWVRARSVAACSIGPRVLRSCAVKLVTCSDLGRLLVPPGWNVGERSDLPRNLRLMGRAAASGPRHLDPGPLLGLYESQPAPPELHVEPFPQPSTGGSMAAERNGQKRKHGIFIRQTPD